MEKEIIERFLQAIENCFSGMNPKTNWPLNGGQIDPYFDVDEALDIYNRINKLKQRFSLEEIAKLMPPADILRMFILNNGIIGLKVAKKLGLAEIKQEDIVEYVLSLFDILKQKVKNDPFCLDRKNHLLDESKLLDQLGKDWKYPYNNEEKRKISNLIVSSNYLCYTLFYDIYMAGGFINHGPYDVSKKFGENTFLIIRDYHNINPKELWPNLKIPYNRLILLTVYKNLDVGINFSNHLITKETIGDKLIAYKIFLDDKEIKIKDIDELINIFNQISKKQADEINSWTNLNKVRKGAEICFYFFKRLRDFMGDSWRHPDLMNGLETVINKFGEEFIKKFKHKENPPLDHWKKLFDPRNDYF